MNDQNTPAATTSVIRQSFSVSFQYPVVFTSDSLHPDNPALRDVLTAHDPARRHRVAIVLDEGLERAFPHLRGSIARYFEQHRTRLELAGAPLTIPGGEVVKNDSTFVDRLHAHFHENRIDRHSFILVAGGGSVLDAVGYAAATTHRGLRHVRMPTTVLAQADSGVGVKNGINAFGAKNFLGTFVPPFGVVNDVIFLDNLPARDRVAGLAEAVKVSLIRDGSFFAWIESHAAALAGGERDALPVAIRRCAELHMKQIAQGGDPFESGSARPLDFGHWAAHKIESLTRNELRHGEAVALGLVLDSRYSVEAGLLPAAEFARIYGLVQALGLPRWHDALLSPDLLGGLQDFREHLGGDLTITLITGIGTAIEVHEMDEHKIRLSLDWMRAHA
jgi:3-dehydroquinate synthase